MSQLFFKIVVSTPFSVHFFNLICVHRNQLDSLHYFFYARVALSRRKVDHEYLRVFKGNCSSVGIDFVVGPDGVSQ